MEQDFADAWVEQLASIWQTRDVEAAVRLFSDCKDYRETPFDQNAMLHPGVRALWQGVLEQHDIEVRVNVRVCGDSTIAAEYRARYTVAHSQHQSSGIWIIEFERDHCIRFEQWFMPTSEI